MEINKKLNIDTDIEFLDTGDIAHASNIVANNTNDGVLNENSIEKYFILDNPNEKVVGYIACSDEFIIFTSLSRIFRCKESSKENIEVNTNWKWEGGNVIGAYTYNINKELIISITELNTDHDVPLKIINLSKPEYVIGESDNKYTLNPEIPQFNLINYNTVNGANMYRGVYNFFIRFKKGEQYTAWYKIGYPIILFDDSYNITVERYVYNVNDGDGLGFSPRNYTITDNVNNDVEKISKNIILGIDINDKTLSYTHYQIGYIVNTTSSEIKIFNTNDYGIKNKRVTISNTDTSGDFTLDDLTSTFFNVYNVKTLCNYNNRLYIANYKEENPNTVVSKIDVSDIIVRAVPLKNEPSPLLVRNNINKRSSIASTYAPVGDSQLVTEVLFGSKYVIKLRAKIYLSDGSYKEVTKWFYSDDTVSTGTLGKGQLIFDINIIFNSILYDIDEEVKGIPYVTEEYNDAYYLIVQNSDNGIISKFSYSHGGSGKDNFKLAGKVYTSNDFIIEELYKVEPGDNKVSQSWFCEPNIKFTEANKYPDIAKNLHICLSTEFNNIYGGTIKTVYNGIFRLVESNSSGSVNGYRLDYTYVPKSCLFLYYTNFFIDKYLEAKYPGSTRKYKYQYTLKDGAAEPTNKDAIYLDSYSNATSLKYSVKVMYNCSLKRLQLCATAVNQQSYSQGTEYAYIDDEVTIIPTSGKQFTFNVNELISVLPVTIPNYNKTVEDFDKSFETSYEWTEDREPNKNDFDPNLSYNLSIYHHGSSDKFRIINVKPKVVGFRNRVTEDNVIKVDKDFAIMIPFKDWFNNTYDKKTDDVSTYRISAGSWSDPVFDEGQVGQLYISFVKDKTIRIDNTDNYAAYLLKVIDADNLMNVEVLLPYTDEKFNIRVNAKDTTQPSTDVTYPVYNAPINEVSNSSGGGEELNFYGDITKQAINNAVYNLFIHYVYPNGSYTDGIRISNNMTYNKTIKLGTANDNGTTIELNYDVNEDTKISDVKKRYTDLLTKYTTIDTTDAHPVVRVFDDVADVRFCNVFPEYNNNGIALYKNTNGDKLFRGSILGNRITTQYNKGFKFVFDNIPMYEEFVGYFISYEKSEPILTGECIVTPLTRGLNANAGSYEQDISEVRLYYPEFDLVKKVSGNILFIEKQEDFNTNWNEIFNDSYYSTDTGNGRAVGTNYISSIKSINVYAPNDLSNNRGRQGILAVNTTNAIRLYNTINQWKKQLTFGLLLNIVDNIYLRKNKELVSLGYIKYVDYEPNKKYEYGYDEYNYNYDYYKVSNQVFDMNYWGVNYDEVHPSAKTNDGRVYTEDFPKGDYSTSKFLHCPTVGVRMNSYSLYPTFAKNIKSKPISKYYGFKGTDSDTAHIYTELVTHVYYTMLNDIYELKPNFYDYADKLISNFDKDYYANFIEHYDKVIRRSDVITNESVENKWRKFRPEQYKIITENKGPIINIIGVGGYLIAHCEHSMFVFNRDSSMRTEDKDVQLIIPDAFDIDYVEMFTSTRGYAGIQKVNQFVCSNYGYIFYDSDAHKLYRFDENNLDEITPGFKNLFKHDIVDINFAIDERNERMICLGKAKIDNKTKHFAISYSFNGKYWLSTHSYWYDDCFNTKNNSYFINNQIIESSVDKFNLDKFGDYTNIIDDNTNIFKTELTIEGKPCSFVDVVFNNDNIDKVLNYISYSVNKATDDNYSGLRLLIYTNCCYSDYIDISVPKKTMKDYKHPYYKYGSWIFNWFRNKIANIGTKNPIIRGNGKLHPDTKFITTKRLNDALVVGKYFVIRFIFYSNDKRISVNNIECH